jgi:exopolysaccharide biosynthesis polyprenyl glycosylphosphotransferase
LIPGAAGVFRVREKKPALRVGAGLQPLAAQVPGSSSGVSLPEDFFAGLMPETLKRLWARNLLSAMVADFALIIVNWLLVVAIFLQFGGIFSHARAFEHATAGAVRHQVLGIALLHAALITLLGYSEGLYGWSGDLRRLAVALCKSAFWATAILCVAAWLLAASAISCAAICVAGALHFAILLAWRRTGRRKARLTAERGRQVRNVLIIGAGPVGRRIAAEVEGHSETGRVVCGFLDDELPMGNRVIGRIGSLQRLARTGFVDEVILAAPRHPDMIQRVLQEARRLRLDVKLVPDLFGCKPNGSDVERFGDLPAICLHQEPSPALGLLVKRIFDAAGAGAALLILSPLLGLIAALIKIGSKGPVLYAAQRAGHKGRLFRCYKFRTMVRDADTLKLSLRRRNQRSGPIFKISGDPRITRLGHILRRYSLDELPQLWNVLKGEMSLVGPRPHPLDDFAGYELEHFARLDVTPGITGLWQVTARRDPSFQRGMDLDREYIQTWSLAQDFRILFRTFRACIEGSGD